MEIHSYYRVIWKHLWFVILACVVGAGSTLFWSINQPPVYSATATLMLNPAIPNALLPSQLLVSSVEALGNTYSQLMKTRSFANLVSAAMGAEVNTGQVLSSVSTQIVPGTQFFRISATANSPEMASKLANTAATVFIQENAARQKARQEQLASVYNKELLVDLEKQKASSRQMLEEELKRYQDRMVSLQRRITELEAQPPSDAQDTALLSLRQQLLDVQNLRIKAMTALVEAEAKDSASGSTPVDTAFVIDDAPLPSWPVSPKVFQNVLYALILSLVVGTGGAFLLEYLDYTFKTPDELELVYGMPALGILEYVGRNRKSSMVREKVVIMEPQSPIAEAFRILRTNVQFASFDKPINSLLVTSAAPTEGKTFTVVNLAIALAQARKRVILVDCDLRRPSIHEIFGLSNEIGITNIVMESKLILDSALLPTEVPGLRILTSGPRPTNPSEILGSAEVETTIRKLQSLADIVLFDSPPTSLVTDAAILATKVDAVLQVVRAGMTRRDLAMKGKNSLIQVGGRVLGPVLNMVRPSDVAYYHRYYRHYYGKQTNNGRGSKAGEQGGVRIDGNT